MNYQDVLLTPLVTGVETDPKKPDKIKNWLLLKDLQFLSYHHETLSKWQANEVVFSTKFHNGTSKIVEFFNIQILILSVFYGPMSSMWYNFPTKCDCESRFSNNV